MPIERVRSATHSRKRSLGALAVSWIEHFCIHGPGDIQDTPLDPKLPGSIPLSDELAALTLDAYALDERGHRLYDSVFYSRPKGANKSGYAAWVACFEALGPCRFAGWAEGGEVFEWMDFRYTYRRGEPMGRIITYPFLRILATEEGQTGNVYDAIYRNLQHGPLSEAFARKDDVGLTRVFLPGGGEIRPSTASSSAKDGGKETWTNFDETHLYFTPELRRMYGTVRRNLGKRREAEPWSFESSTMYAPGQESVAEATHDLAKQIRDGKVRIARLLFDHRQAPAETDLADEASLRAGLIEAYGDAASYMPIDRLISEIWDARNDVVDSRRYFLNQVTAATDSWLAPHEWDACADSERRLQDGDMVALGFDGSKSRDHSVLSACRIDDSHIQGLGIWDPALTGGKVPTEQVDAAVRRAFERFDVVAFFCDVHEWESSIDAWEQSFGDSLCVRSSDRNPIKWDMREGIKATKASEAFHTAVLERDLTHDGNKQHAQYVYNARRWPNRFGVTFGKESPSSDRKVDHLAADILAREARQRYLMLPESKKRQRELVATVWFPD